METGSIGFALLLTLLAGLATGIGSAIAFFAKHTDKKFLSFALGFSAGVMIYVSFMELLFTSYTEIQVLMEGRTGQFIAITAFFGGMAIAAIIDKLVPSVENPHEMRSVEMMRSHSKKAERERNLARTGIITALALAVHNFMCTYTSNGAMVPSE